MLLELSVVQQRYNAVTEVLRDGCMVVAVAGRYGVSRQAVHRWLRRYQQGGLDALADRSHRPVAVHTGWLRSLRPACASCAGPIPAGAAAAGPRAGPPADHPAAAAGHDLPGVVGNGLVEPQARRRRKTAWRRWQRERPMQLWQMDAMGGLVLADGGQGKLVTGIDDHSRFCVAAGSSSGPPPGRCAGVFTAALARHGLPQEELLTDIHPEWRADGACGVRPAA